MKTKNKENNKRYKQLHRYKQRMFGKSCNDAMLRALNNMALILLSDEGEAFDDVLQRGIAPIAEEMGVDRISVCLQIESDNPNKLRRIFIWNCESGPEIPEIIDIPKNDITDKWVVTLHSSDCVNRNVSKARGVEREFFDNFGLKGVCLVPIFIRGQYRGIITFGDHVTYKNFADDEVETMRSVSHLCALTISRYEMVQSIKEHKEAAEKSSRYKSEFLAKMSHEIRTPLNAIIGMTELALRTDNHKSALEHIATVKQAGANLLAIVNEILDFSKIESGRLAIVNSEYSMASLLGDVISIIRMRVVNTPVRFAVKADSNIPNTLYGDEIKIRQAVLNILGNAVKYTESGFVLLSVFTTNSESDDEVNLVFEISDSGHGIKQENINDIFNDFMQVDTYKHRYVEGVGLGLPITRGIVEAMNGDIDVVSEYGYGSTFTLTIPQKICCKDALASVENAGKINALVYIDDDIYLDSLTYSLLNLKVGCSIAGSDSELFEKLNSETFDFLFISHNLYTKYKKNIKKYENDTIAVILIDVGETHIQDNAHVLTMPTYCTQIANILNGTTQTAKQMIGSVSSLSFTAPDANILVVDDMYTNLKVAEGLLSLYKAKIELCSSGADAIEIVKRGAETGKYFDMIFMDHRMPGIDGVEAVSRIRSLDGENSDYFKNVPIIAFTANAVTNMISVFMVAGFSDCIFKPVDALQLNTILEKWIPKEKQKYK